MSDWKPPKEEPLRLQRPPQCDRPPAGWFCTREKDHDGPCAAWPVDGTCPQCRRPKIDYGRERSLSVRPSPFVCTIFDEDDCHKAELLILRGEHERLQVQLAGCATAAQGHTSDPATPDGPSAYGWSPAYQDVLDLRLKYDELNRRHPRPRISTGTRTFAIMEVSKQTFVEVEQKMRAASYDHVFSGDEDGMVIDMHGVALRKEKG